MGSIVNHIVLRRLWPLCAVALPLLTLLAVSPSAAAVYNVTGTADGLGVISGSSSPFQASTFRAAIMVANQNPGVDTINLSPSAVYTLTLGPSDSALGQVVEQSGDLDITGPVVINGNGATVDAGGLDRVLDIQSASLTDFEVIINNLTIKGGAAKGFLSAGGGIQVRAATLRMRGCTVLGCTTEENGSTDNGGGIAASSATYPNTVPATLDLEDCVVRGNTAGSGGGIAAGGCHLTLQRCRLENNMALDSPGGAGVFLAGEDSTTDIVNTSFTGGAATWGGGIFSFYASPILQNTTIAGNGADMAGALSGWGGQVEVANSILHGNVSGAGAPVGFLNEEPFYEITYSCVEGGYPGEGNISADPLLADPAEGNILLLAGSPAIDAGFDAAAAPVDIHSTPRPVDGDMDGLAVSDMGAVEARTTVASAAKTAPAGAPVNTGLGIVTRVFDGYFYAEQRDRAWGIRVETEAVLPEPGQKVSVLGTLDVTGDDEKYIRADAVARMDGEPVRPILMWASRVGGGDFQYDELTGTGQRGITGAIGLNNTGLLADVWGTVTAVEPGYFILDDGSGVADPSGVRGLRVVTEGFDLEQTGVDDRIRLTGISSCFVQNGALHRLIRLSSEEDLRYVQRYLSGPPGGVISSGHSRRIGNLLHNGGAEAGSMQGWTVLSTGGSDGWTLSGGGWEGIRSFLTSFNWCRRMQTVNLMSAGYTAQELDAGPRIVAADRFRGTWPNYSDRFELRVRLKNESGQIIDQDETGLLTASTAWQTAWLELESSTGVRTVEFEDAGDDAEYWAGFYGTLMDGAEVIVEPWHPVRIEQLPPLDILQVRIRTINGSITLAQTGNITFIQGDGSADREMVFEGEVRNLNSALNSFIYTPDAGFQGPDRIIVSINYPGTAALESHTIPLTVQ